MSKSIVTLTEAQKEFYQLLRIRATSEKFGQPYISYAIFKLIPINAPGLKTMGVDEHYRLYIDFDYMMEQGLEFASKVLNHEPWHPLRNHAARFKNVNATPMMWNYAGDLEINDDIVDKVPANSIFPKNFNLPDNETAEWYLEKLKEQAGKAQAEKDKQDKKDGKDKQDGDKGDSQPGDSDGGQQPGDGSGQPGNQQGNGGGNQPGDKGGQQPNDGTGGGLADPTDLLGKDNPCASNGKSLEDYKLAPSEAETVSEFDQEMIGREVAQQVKDYAARKPGSVPGGLKLWADDKLTPTTTPWQKVLRGAFRSTIDVRGQMDYVKSRPNRKQPVKGVLLPAMRAKRPRLGIGIDTSGSHVPMLPRVLDEVHSIIKKAGVRGNELRVFPIDTRMAAKPQFVSDARKVNLAGGGGTDMMPAFKWAAENKKDTDIFVLMTDGEVPTWPQEIPTNLVRLIVCILNFEGESDSSFTRAEAEMGHWAKVIHIIVPREQVR